LNGVDDAVRRGLRWSNPGVADAASYVVAFGLAPAAAYGLDALSASNDGAARYFWADALVITEATVLATDVNQLVKFIAGRERPFVHVLPPDQRAATSQPADNNLSFFSGHTTLAFALAASSGTVASMRGYRLAPVVWTVAMTIAAAAGYLRIAADRHYFTDVLAGSVAGAGIGFAVPFFFHGPRRAGEPSVRLSTSPVVGGQTVTIKVLW
jgi:membrane-associated phospholipid phosphatase